MIHNNAQIFLSLGSNVGDRAIYLKQAIEALKRYVDIILISHIYETPPWGDHNQRPFYNLALSGMTKLPPLSLLDQVKMTEKAVGRLPRRRWGPREIDIDILFYDRQIFHHPRLIIPHPFVGERPFVLFPLQEIAPHLRHPQTGKSIAQLAALHDPTAVAKIKKGGSPNQSGEPPF